MGARGTPEGRILAVGGRFTAVLIERRLDAMVERVTLETAGL